MTALSHYKNYYNQTIILQLNHDIGLPVILEEGEGALEVVLHLPHHRPLLREHVLPPSPPTPPSPPSLPNVFLG